MMNINYRKFQFGTLMYPLIMYTTLFTFYLCRSLLEEQIQLVLNFINMIVNIWFLRCFSVVSARRIECPSRIESPFKRTVCVH